MNCLLPYEPVWRVADVQLKQQELQKAMELYSGNEGREFYPERTFIDLFAGAGCLSLGLMSSGWKGIFAVEKNATAFETLSHNLIEGPQSFAYQWPGWFPKKPCTVGRVAGRYQQQLLDLRGKVTLIVGGPPCQGFSSAGKRDGKDSRNSLFKAYVRIVEAVQPLFILLENVQGITIEFGKTARTGRKKVGRPPIPYSQRAARALSEAGYEVQAGLLRAAEFGVPQFRPRYFLFAVRKCVFPSLKSNNPFKALSILLGRLLAFKRGFPTDRPVSVSEAISDLETVQGRVPCVGYPKFMQGTFAAPISNYQRLMRHSSGEVLPDSHRLANHRPETVARFAEILASCRRGVQLRPR